MKELSYSEIRERYLDFMKSNGHAVIPSASLVPEDDPSMLFIDAGMVPLVPYLIGEKHPAGTRLTDVQRCLRTKDIEEVGNVQHCTTFEMLGNWSLNDYFKEEAIGYTIEFFRDTLGIDINRIYGSAFMGNKNAPRDEVSIAAWKRILKDNGVDAKVGQGEHIQLFGNKCWWELNIGGPCGPCSELFYDTGQKACGPDCNINCSCGKYIELGNNVFMEYLKKDNTYSPLGRYNVDFGGGLERQVMISQKKASYYETDMYLPIFRKVQDLSTKDIIRSQRIIVDHLKAATWIAMDGVKPGRTEREYILRRLIRRAIRHGRIAGIEGEFTNTICTIAINQFRSIYPKLADNRDDILGTIEDEERKFRTTIDAGTRKFNDLVAKKGALTGEDAFYLFETFGFPLEITQEMLAEQGLTLDNKGFDQAYERHQTLSRTAAEGFFEGGLSDTSDMSKKYHTATHLLNAALRKVLGDHVHQKGSNINPERLRFDFPNDEKLTDEQVQQVETLVNEQITKKLPVSFEDMPKDKAIKLVTTAMFADKYGDTVKVFSIGTGKDLFSREICGGPHVANTHELGKFKIIKQENVGSGIRRIKAVLSDTSINTA